MQKSVRILTSDRYLYQKIALELSVSGFIVTLDDSADALLCDIDSCEMQKGAITMSRTREADIRLPARLGDIPRALNGKQRAPLSLLGERAVSLFGKKIQLTEIEYALLSFLMKKRDFASREEILERVWNNGADGGVVNVYIHYLREKLERGGERVIISSRRDGYRIREELLLEVVE